MRSDLSRSSYFQEISACFRARPPTIGIWLSTFYDQLPNQPSCPDDGYTNHEQPKTGFADVMQSISTQNDESNRKNASDKPAEYWGIKAARFE
jgi:hypothetical protein